MSIQVTLTFASEDELIKYFARDKVGALAAAVVSAPKPQINKEPSTPKAEKPKAETPTPTPTPAATETASPAASSASSSEAASSVDYPTLQKAVFALANAKGRDAVVTLLKDKFSVNSAKELAAEQYADALAAVTAATEA